MSQPTSRRASAEEIALAEQNIDLTLEILRLARPGSWDLNTIAVPMMDPRSLTHTEHVEALSITIACLFARLANP